MKTMHHYFLYIIITIILGIIVLSIYAGIMKKSALQYAQLYLSSAYNGDKETLLHVCTEERFANCLVINYKHLQLYQKEYPICKKYQYVHTILPLKMNVFTGVIDCCYEYMYNYMGENAKGEKCNTFSKADAHMYMKMIDWKWMVVGFYEAP